MITNEMMVKALENSNLFDRYNIGKEIEAIELAAFNNKEKILDIARKSGPSVLFRGLFTIGYYAGKNDAEFDGKASAEYDLLKMNSRIIELSEALAEMTEKMNELKREWSDHG